MKTDLNTNRNQQDRPDFDVLIIGAGVTGSACARELAKTDLRIGVLEKEMDVCEGTSKANSGIVHAGYDALPGTLKAKLNVQGAAMMKELSKTLDFDYQNCGSLVLCFEEAGRPALYSLYERGLANGVEGLEILEKEAVLDMEPSVNPDVVCALYAPSAGIVCPFGLNLALAESAALNGVQFFFSHPVKTIARDEEAGLWLINGSVTARAVINCAGVHADEIHNLAMAACGRVEEDLMKLGARRGEYFLLDHSAARQAQHVLFQLPSAKGKGVLIAPTVHGNLLVGPNAQWIEDKEDTETTSQGLEEIAKAALKSEPKLTLQDVITTFAGIRAVPEGGDFIIQWSAPGFLDAAGIESPGLTSAPAIGAYVAEMVCGCLAPGKNPDFKAQRKGIVRAADLSFEERQALCEKDPEYGLIVCRCEQISAAEIRQACRGILPARTTDGIKRRVRAGMGRCQAGFCLPKTMEILAQEQKTSMPSLKKSGQSSVLVFGQEGEAHEA